MSKFKEQSEVIDIRDGKQYVIIDSEVFDEMTLYYTKNSKSIPEHFLVSPEITLLSAYFDRKINGGVITEWLKNNTELSSIVPSGDGSDLEKHIDDLLKKYSNKNPKKFLVESLFVRIRDFICRTFR